MQVIDFHVHLYPPELNMSPGTWAAAHGEGHWATLCTRVRRDGRPVQTFPSVDDLLRAMDVAGVEKAVLQGWYWESPETCAWQNDFYAQCIQVHPDRLAAFAAFHPGKGDSSADAQQARDEIRWAADNGFSGLGELSPHSQSVNPNSPILREAFSLAGVLGLAVGIHVTEEGGRPYPGKIETPLRDFVQWAQEHPLTEFILAHWGARLPLDAELGAEAWALKNISYDTAASPLTYGAGSPIWREMVDAVGADRILFGTDFPLILYPKTETTPAISSLVAEARASGLNEAELSAILSENAKRMIR